MASASHSTSPPRRRFLSGLLSLPLIGGSVALIGQPSAVAEPISLELMESYRTWLHYEELAVCWEMAAWTEGGTPLVVTYRDRVARCKAIDSYRLMATPAADFHDWKNDRNPPSRRAALVLSAVGCDWRAA